MPRRTPPTSMPRRGNATNPSIASCRKPRTTDSSNRTAGPSRGDFHLQKAINKCEQSPSQRETVDVPTHRMGANPRPSASDPTGDFSYDATRGKGSTLLPSNELAQVISCEEDVAFGLMHLVVSRLRAFQMSIGEATETVRNRAP